MHNGEKVKPFIWVLDGDKFKFRYNWNPRKGGNGFGLSSENVSYTLNTIDMHMVAYEKRYGAKGRECVCKGGKGKGSRRLG